MIRHIRLKHSFKANPLYPSQEDMSFIVCYRYEMGSNQLPEFTLESQGAVSSTGVLNVAILHK